ncbi:putative permease [Beggiatoa alba B18LD]|uniref:Putative permease n=1 Tax=Beggiatoa alba B18LD TaxID=395493 RepID=I3CJX6_9GAMM|nr:permease [Beggiatoa alba]EIJ43919.1 putative permease [Beggiatoa alba B18LD]
MSLPILALKLSGAFILWLLLYLNLQVLTEALVYQIFGLSKTNAFGIAVAFFIFEVPKVLLLLSLIIFIMGVIRSFFTPESTRALLAGKANFLSHILAALLGVVTPFCSCSAVPLFIGFLTAGVPLGVTFAFLIAAPMVNEIALGLLFGLFGWHIAGLYLSMGLIIAILSGYVLGKLGMEQYVEDWVYKIPPMPDSAEARLTMNDRIELGIQAVRDIVGKVWFYVLLGIAVGAGIHGYVPENILASLLGASWWSVPLAILVGIPMYSNAAGVIPIVQALLAKGAALGTVLVFMMAVTALSLPEMIILRKVLKVRLIVTFISIVALGILTVGYLFNAIM